MDTAIDRPTLERRPQTRLAAQILEAAIESALGIHVQIIGVNLWISSAIMEANRIPERYVTLEALEALAAARAAKAGERP